MSITFYYGSDSFRVREAMGKKIAYFLAQNKNGLVEKLDFEKENCPEDIEHILKRRSFFDEPELIVIYAFLSVKDLRKKDEKFFKFLSKEAKEIKEFENLRGAALEKWALEKISQAGFSVKSPVLKKLLSRVVSSPFGRSPVGGQEHLSQEIEKLMAYQSYHGRTEIEDKAVESLTKAEVSLNNFALIDALGARDIKKAVIFLNQVLLEGTEPNAVLGQIIYQFRNLLRVKTLHLETGFPSVEMVVKLTALHPFVAEKTSQQSRQFELEELKKIYGQLAEMDLKSKTGQIDLPTALFQLILGV